MRRKHPDGVLEDLTSHPCPSRRAPGIFGAVFSPTFIREQPILRFKSTGTQLAAYKSRRDARLEAGHLGCRDALTESGQ
jgi:hypothetical protein